MQKFMTIKEAAELLACSTRHVRRIIASGHLPVHAIGTGKKGDRISPSDLEHYLARQKRNRGMDGCQSTNVTAIGGLMSRSPANGLEKLLGKGRGKTRRKILRLVYARGSTKSGNP
jgi:excisionase family DNA binding protein